MAIAAPEVASLVSALPPLNSLEGAVARDTAALRNTVAANLPIAVQSAALERAPAARERLAGMLERGVALLRAHRAAEQQLPSADRECLDALFLVYGRPAIPVRDDQFGPPPLGWEVLDAARPSIETALRSVGRIERVDGEWVEPLGTGFLVAPGVLMTAGHVALKAAAGMSRIDWRVEADRDAAFSRVELVELLWTDERDVALVRIDPATRKPQGARLPRPLALSPGPPKLEGKPLVFCVGYPTRGGEGNLRSEFLERIFPGLLGSKRIAPGRLCGTAGGGVLTHDCSTLGGSSGAPLFPLIEGSQDVLGVHLGGGPFDANVAQATFPLASSIRSKLGVTTR